MWATDLDGNPVWHASYYMAEIDAKYWNNAHPAALHDGWGVWINIPEGVL